MLDSTTTINPGPLADFDDAVVADALRRFVECFRSSFARVDQVSRLELYLRGLLSVAGRKSVQELARVSGGEAGGDTAQALHHFIGQSTWDEVRLLSRYRHWAAPRLGPGVLTASEFAFSKRGSRSVGVQRQFGHMLGRKANCQLAIVIGRTTPMGWWPLTVRLYLPRDWVRDEARLSAAGVPIEARGAVTRPGLALQLLDAVRADVPGESVMGDSSLVNAEEFRSGLEARGLSEVSAGESTAGHLEPGTRMLADTLGLGHFEGRSWRGWHHHAALVLLAYGFCQTLTRTQN